MDRDTEGEIRNPYEKTKLKVHRQGKVQIHHDHILLRGIDSLDIKNVSEILSQTIQRCERLEERIQKLEDLSEINTQEKNQT